jgi:hypothetical protein
MSQSSDELEKQGGADAPTPVGGVREPSTLQLCGLPAAARAFAAKRLRINDRHRWSSTTIWQLLECRSFPQYSGIGFPIV